jgi:hypothetical protein
VDNFLKLRKRSAHWLLILPVALLSACATITPSRFPAAWALPAHQVQDECLAPVGDFSNIGIGDDPDQPAPTLASILFEDQLRGFPVESIAFSLAANGQAMLLDGVLDGVPLDRPVQVANSEGSCQSRWRRSFQTQTVNSTLVTESVLWTGGMIIPVREINHVTLMLAADGALLAELQVNSWILGALIPVKLKNTYWLRYEPIERRL